VLLLDALNSNLPDQAHVRASMVEFLKKLPPGQPIAIYLLGYKLRLIQDFTSDPAVLQAAISNLKNPGSGIVDNPAGTSPLSDLPPGSVAQATLTPQMRAHILAFQNERIAAQTGFRIQYTLNALNALGRTLAGYPGRKNLMWMSESFPFNVRTIAKGASSAQSYSYEVASTGSLLNRAESCFVLFSLLSDWGRTRTFNEPPYSGTTRSSLLS
jgi:VWFA-related protein